MALSFILPALDVRPGELSAAERAVLVALAEDARTGAGMASPGHERLTAVSGLKNRQVSNVLRSLVEMGLIVLHQAARTGRRAVYKLLIAERTRDSETAPQCGQTGSNQGAESAHSGATLPGSSSPRKNPVARARDAASKIRKSKGNGWQGPTVLPPSNAPTNPLRPEPRPDLSALPEPPAWAVERARAELGRFAARPAVLAVARTIAAEQMAA